MKEILGEISTLKISKGIAFLNPKPENGNCVAPRFTSVLVSLLA